MTLSTWLGGTGDWSDAALWSAGAPDSASMDAAIAATGSYTLTIASDESFAVRSVDLDAVGATLQIDGALTLAGTFDLAAGTLDLTSSGVIHGGTLQTSGAALNFAFGTLDGVTVIGPLSITPQLSWLTITHGLSVNDSQGYPGLITLDGDSCVLDFKGTQTFDNATITIGSAEGFFGGDSIVNSGRLTLGAHCQIESLGLRALATIGGASVLNLGSITAGAQYGLFEIAAANFTNQGLITVTGLNATLVTDGGRFNNGAGGVLVVGATDTALLGEKKGTFLNQGHIIVGSGGSLVLMGSYSAANLGAITNLGLIYLDGEFQNAGAIVTLGSGSLNGFLAVGATIVGGVVTLASDAHVRWGATLDGVTFRGPLNIDGDASDTVIVEGGLALTGRGGAGPGLARIDGADSHLVFSGDQTFDNATLLIGDPAGKGEAIDDIDVSLPAHAAAATLTLGPKLHVIACAAGERVDLGEESGGATIVNAGLITADALGGTCVIDPDVFINSGRIGVSGGDTLETGLFCNFTNAGSVSVGAGGTFYFNAGTFSTFANSGAINVAVGGTLGVTGAYTLASLGAIHVAGTFVIDGYLDNTGQTLRVGAGPLLGGAGGVVLGINAQILGGTLALGGGPMTWAGGDLKDVTVAGDVEMSGAAARLFVDSGVDFTGAGGVGRGRIDLTGGGAILDFLGAQSLDDTTIDVGHAGGTDTIELFVIKVARQTLSFGAGVVVEANVAHSTVTVQDSYPGPDTFLNAGAIEAVAAHGTFTVAVRTFTNDGRIAVGDQDTFTVNGALNGAGQFTLSTGGALVLGAVRAAQRIVFTDGTGHLTLTAGMACDPTVVGFRAGDMIDLTNLAADAVSVNAEHQLVLTDKGAVVAQIHLSGGDRKDVFAIASDGSGGVSITAMTPAPHAMVQAIAAMAPRKGLPCGGAFTPPNSVTALLIHRHG